MRTALSSAPPVFICSDFLQARAMGVIPYLGTFLTDLTMTHSAFPDTLHVRQTVGLWSQVIITIMSSLGEEW